MTDDFGTLGYLIDSRTQLRIYCGECRHNDWLDLEKAAAKFGRDYSYLADDLLPRLKCPKCNGKRLSMQVHPG